MRRVALMMAALAGLALAQQVAGGGGSGNATKLQGVPVSATAPSNGTCLVYSSTSGTWQASSCAGTASTAWSAVTGGTNTTAAMVVGTGASIAATGTGTIAATSVPAAGLGAGTIANSTSGNAATATALATYPTLCTGGQVSQGIWSGSNNCTSVAVPSAASPTATAGAAAVNGTATTFMRSDASPAVAIATTTTKGIVSTDGATITNTSGAISCTTATTAQLGCVKPDGSTITISGGVISAAGGGGSTIVKSAQYATADQLTASGTFATTYTIPANTLKAGSLIEVWAAGPFSITAGEFLKFGITLGSTAALPNVGQFLNAGTGNWNLVGRCVVSPLALPGRQRARDTLSREVAAVPPVRARLQPIPPSRLIPPLPRRSAFRRFSPVATEPRTSASWLWW